MRGRLPTYNPLSPSRKNDLPREPVDLIGFRTGVWDIGTVKERIIRAFRLLRTSGKELGGWGFAAAFLCDAGGSQNKRTIGIVGLFGTVVFHTVLPVIAEKIEAQTIVGKVHFV